MDEFPHLPTIDLLKNGLEKLGYVCETFFLDTLSFTQFTAPSGQIWLTETNKVGYPFNSSTARRISSLKHLSYALASRIGAQTPFTTTLDSRQNNSAQYQALLQQAPLVVKPNSASLSHGLALNITTAETLDDAITAAGTFSDLVLVQKQLPGEEIRFMVVGNKVKAALLRQTPRLIGDGSSTLAELLKAENNDRQTRGLQYPDLDQTIVDVSKLDMTAVPTVGAMIELGRGTMIARGASMFNVHHQVHPSYIAMAEKLAAAFGSGFVAVDMFISDYAEPLTDSNYAFIEFGMSPVLNLLYKCRDGQNYDILNDLIPLIDSRITGGVV